MAKGYSSYGRRGGKSAYRYTAKRQQALRRAQFISAQKRKRNAKIKKVAVIGGIGVLAAGGVGAGVLLGKGSGSKNIRSSVKSAGAFGKDLTSAFRAVDPYKKEKTRKERAVTRKRKASERGREAARSGGNVEKLGKMAPSEVAKSRAEGNERHGATWLNESSFNKDGTVSPKIVHGTPLTDRELRSGISRASRNRGNIGGKPLTRKQQGDAFKILKANQKASGGALNPTTGKQIRSTVPKISGTGLGSGGDEVTRVFKAAMRQRFDDDKLLQDYGEG